MAESALKNEQTYSDNLPIYRPNGRALGVLFEDLNVWGAVAGESRVQDLTAVFEDVLIRWPTNIFRQIVGRSLHHSRALVQGISGVVEPGKTLLVLGRPGAGCSTLLKVLANQRDGFTGVNGHIQYGDLSADDIRKHYGSEVVYNAEDDIHFPTLSVGHAMEFAFKLRKPKRMDHEPDDEFSRRMTDKVLGSLGIGHTKNTIIGDAYVRGVSGGERKRVSLAEVLAAAPALVCWDNPLRGLDSSSALQFLKLLKELSSATGMVNVVTAYQVSETIYQECFDNVLLLYEGRMIYSGPAGNEAKTYFTSHLGFYCPPRQTTPDFLTSITSPEEQRITEGHMPPPPLDPDGLAKAFQSSSYNQLLGRAMSQYRGDTAGNTARTSALDAEVTSSKHPLSSKSAMTVRTFHTQIMIAITRYYQLLWGGKKSLFTVLALNMINALVIGAANYMTTNTNTGAFQRSGAIFFALIFFALNSLAETGSTIRSRFVLRKHHNLGMLHPGLASIATTIADLPVCFAQSVLFTIPYYFLIGMPTTAGGFWFFQLVIFVSYASFLALFRMLGAWAPNMPVAFMLAGAAMPVVLMYSGYAPTWPTQLRWGSWIRRISPSPFGLEALMGFEFWGETLVCTENELVPHGVGYENITSINQGCPLPGNSPGSISVSGPDYLWAHFNYLPTNAWHNFGIIVCFWAIYTTLMALGQTFRTKNSESGAVGRVYKRGAVIPDPAARNEKSTGKECDLEAQSGSNPTFESGESSSASSITQTAKMPQPDHADTKASFTFSDVSYEVTVDGSPRKLLNSVNGYVKPGQLTALMGVSGAGKTTLLDTLALRKTEGTTSGDMRLGGQSLSEMGAAFSEACGFCMQQDVHDPGTTVYEALIFSAMMRRPLSVTRAEKEAHIESVMDLLALRPIADAVIGIPGEGGLGVEERKRLTIGVELAAAPSALLFLDEPTSGLDSQAAYSLVRFLQDVAASGVPIVCTIHQPSAMIFDMFDHILLLAPGGRTVYFGETGDKSNTVVDYFARNGAPMDSTANPAEFILGNVADPSAADLWSQRWNDSTENGTLKAQIQMINENSPNVHMSPRHLPLLHQFNQLTMRHAISIWRDGFYIFSRLVKAIFMALFTSFTFFNIKDTEQGAQNRMLVLLLLQWLVPATAADLQDVWFAKWALFKARERSGVGYSPLALCGALVAVEVPIAIVIYTLAFLCSWFTVGLGEAGFGYLNFLALGIFGIGFPFAVASFSANGEVAGYANSLLWCIMATFGGIAVPHESMNNFYRPWLFWADPMRYWLGATSAAVLHGVPIRCAQGEMTTMEPADGLTCGDYLENFFKESFGYVDNPLSTTNCSVCPYSSGDEYAVGFDFYYETRWRDWGIFTAFCISTLAIAFAVSWLKFARWPRISK